MEETLQHETTPQCPRLPPTGTGNHRPDGPKAGHALTIKLDHSGGADHHRFGLICLIHSLLLSASLKGASVSVKCAKDFVRYPPRCPLSMVDTISTLHQPSVRGNRTDTMKWSFGYFHVDKVSETCCVIPQFANQDRRRESVKRKLVYCPRILLAK